MEHSFTNEEAYNEWHPTTNGSEPNLFPLGYPFEATTTGEEPSQLLDDTGTLGIPLQNASWDQNYDTSPLEQILSVGNNEGCDYAKTACRHNSLQTIQRSIESEDSQSQHSPHDNPQEHAEFSTAKERLACPYYKHDPIRFKHSRSCAGPGFSGIPRLKEHLYRRHASPQHRCSRCLIEFTTEASLRQHQRAPQACEITSDQQVDGKMTTSQQTALRSKKRRPAPSTDESKWNDIYCPLFPDTNPLNIPSPYLDETGLEQLLWLHSSMSS
ncbi:hypothetical protein F4806DRAFT_164844 [Annulohypoxylon nitens]|nr:hypothetical protein F4806DRAFT_164844 [Annulohypoxylon nitens]